MFFMPTNPEEMRQAIEHERMHADADSHAVKSFIEGLDNEQLDALRILLVQGIQSDGSGILNYYLGVINAFRHIKHNVCIACGVNHDEQAMQAMQHTAPEPLRDQPVPPPTSDKTQVMNFDGIPDPWMEGTFTRAELLARYNLMETETGIVCLGCGQRYISLEDRMIKPPGQENCSNCVQKEKWG